MPITHQFCQSVRIEADKKAQEWWDTTVAQCGADHYVKTKWRYYISYPAAIYEHEDLVEFRSSGFAVIEQSLSQADKLNGYEWKGIISVPISAHRSYELASNDLGRKSRTTGGSLPSSRTGWSAWDDGAPKRPADILAQGKPMVGTTFYKQNGEWHYATRDMQSKPNCVEVP